MSKLRLFQLCTLVMLLYACNNNPLDIDVSNVEIDYRSSRFDEALFRTDFSNPQSAHQDLYQSFGQFWIDYQEAVLRVGQAGDSMALAECQAFVTDATIQEIQTVINKVHDNRIEDYDEQFEDAFKHFNYYFDDQTPEIFYYNSGFNFGIYPLDTILAVGLDFYLGADNEIIQKLPPSVFPLYKQVKMDPKYLVSDAMRGWLLVKNQGYMEANNLLGQMMYFGKVLYILDACMPNVPDSIKMNYSSSQDLWANTNEELIWKELAQEEVLYENKGFEINKWMADGPFTNTGNVPQDSPPQLGIWIGWQVVRDYMVENPDMTLQQLLEETNYSKMLQVYNPKD